MTRIGLTWRTWVSLHQYPPPISLPQSAENQSIGPSPIVPHLLATQAERGMLLPHVVLFILDTFQRTRVERRGRRERPPCRISYKYCCLAPYVGTGPKHRRQSACGKAWAFYRLESPKVTLETWSLKEKQMKWTENTDLSWWPQMSDQGKATSLPFVLADTVGLGYLDR